MRIGFDGSCLSNRRGFGRFARRLLEALAVHPTHHEIVVIIDGPSESKVMIPKCFERVVVDVSEAPSAAASASGRRRFRDMFAMGRAVATAGLDLMYFPATYTFFPVWNVSRVAVTMHDTLALAHPKLVFPHWTGRYSWLLKEYAAVWFSDRIITVSETSRRDLQSWFGLPEERLWVVSEGPDPIFRPQFDRVESDRALSRRTIPLESKYLLYVGGLSPHKNLLRLIDAFSLASGDDTRLVLVGDLNDVFHSHVPEIRAAISRVGLEDRVILTGFVPDAELVHLYNRAYALVQPSLMEGFGLPAVEAMACGTPVISSRAGSLPEVVGDAGVYFDPTEIDSITKAIAGILQNRLLRDGLATRVLERSRRFTWERSAQSLVDCFDQFEEQPRLRWDNSRGLWGKRRTWLKTKKACGNKPQAFEGMPREQGVVIQNQ